MISNDKQLYLGWNETQIWVNPMCWNEGLLIDILSVAIIDKVDLDCSIFIKVKFLFKQKIKRLKNAYRLLKSEHT